MASLYFAEKNTAWYLPIKLFPQSSSPTEWIASPTIATGDFKRVGYDSTGAVTLASGNLTTTPSTSPASSGWVLLSLSATEMNNDIVCIDWKDASGAEWASGGITVMTTADNVDDLTTVTDTINANITQISSDSTAADNLEAALDGTGGVTITAALTGSVTGNLSGSVGSVTAGVSLADSAITSAKFAAGAITAAAIATDAIDADALAADAVTEIQSGLATATALATVDTVVDAILIDTAEIGTAGAGLTALASATNLATLAGYVDTEVAAIKAKTDNLPASPANEATLTTIAGYLDTEVASILAAVDTEVGAIKTVTDALPNSGALTTITNNVASILADTGTDGVVLSTAQMQALADIVLARSVSNIDNTASTHSLYELIQAFLESNTSTGSWVIYKTNGSTTFNTRTLATDAEALPIVGVS